MVKYREYSEAERLKMFELRKNDRMSFQKIADQFGCTDMTVKYNINKIEKYGIARNLERSGRKRCTTESDDRILKRIVMNRRTASAETIAHELKDRNITCSSSTVRNRLIEQKFFSGVQRKRPMISDKNRKSRLDFAKKYISMPMDFWKKVLWSDESLFPMMNNKRVQRIWKKRSEGLNKKNIRPTETLKRCYRMGVCLGFGRRESGRNHRKMDAPYYVNKILAKYLCQSAEKLEIRGNFVFQSDNDPKHTSRLAKKWLSEHVVEVLEWPAQSPDLNIIEHLWDHLDRNVDKSKRTSLQTFRTALFETWRNIDHKTIDRLIESIPKRLQAVIDAKGGNTTY